MTRVLTAYRPLCWAFCALLTLQSAAWAAFEDVTEEAGIRFGHENGATGDHWLPETLGSGAAFFDYDRDGFLDIYLVNGGDFQGDGAENRLFRNLGDGTFEDVTDATGVGDTGVGVGVAVGDTDGDGWEDIYVCNFGRNVLYRNLGDGTFADITDAAGVGEARWSGSAAFFDLENDGDLDLYVTNYLDYQQHRDGCEHEGLKVYCGPERFDPLTDTLYRNDDGAFTDVSAESGITTAGRGLAVAAADYDDDGDADLFVANDMTPDFLYQNQGDGTFEEIGFIVGIALSEDATMGNGMGVDLADFDNDGGLDLIVTNFEDQVNTLYRNDRDGFFTDVSFPSETAIPGLPLLAWGCAILDFDNDGWRDLFVANGHIHDNVEQWSDLGVYAQPKLLFRNDRDGTFSNVANESGTAMTTPNVSRGAAFGDFDNDGDMDILVTNLRGEPSLYRNDGGNANGWIRVALEPAAWAVGARVTVETDDGAVYVDEITGGGSYASHSDARLLFGLGDAESARVTVKWRDGRTDESVSLSSGETATFHR